MAKVILYHHGLKVASGLVYKLLAGQTPIADQLETIKFIVTYKHSASGQGKYALAHCLETEESKKQSEGAAD